MDRVPALRKDELRRLSEIGALNFLRGVRDRRDALWQSELALRPAGPLFAAIEEEGAAEDRPLKKMTVSERMHADFRGTSLTIGKHPMAHHRERLRQMGVVPADRLHEMRNGQRVSIAGCVICRQRPGTAKGLCFLSLEDETGISNAVLMPDTFDRYRMTLLENSYLFLEGELQNIDRVVSVKVEHMAPLEIAEAAPASHDFH